MEMRELSTAGWGLPVIFFIDEQEIRIKHNRSMTQTLVNRGLLRLFHKNCGKAVDKM